MVLWIMLPRSIVGYYHHQGSMQATAFSESSVTTYETT
jgi:hypothetical protein